jgi:hypothetical protein
MHDVSLHRQSTKVKISRAAQNYSYQFRSFKKKKVASRSGELLAVAFLYICNLDISLQGIGQDYCCT